MNVKEIDAYPAPLWDKQIEEDLDSGRLQTLLDEAERDLESGCCQAL